jgi:uncharacterized RDD family membrane protein YckC
VIPPAQDLPRAGLARRLAAVAYDALLVAAVVLVLGFAMLPLVTPTAAAGAGRLSVPPLPVRVVLFAVIFAVLAAYFTWSWSQGRATLAQKTWRLRVVDRNGDWVSIRTALARYLACWVGPALAGIAYLVQHPQGHGAHAAWLVTLNFLWALLDRDRQYLHDRIAGTRIVTVVGARPPAS